MRGPIAAEEDLAAIDRTPPPSLPSRPTPKRCDPTLPDGSQVARIPGASSGSGTSSAAARPAGSSTPALPPHVLGHVGYTIVPWKRRQGCATEAVRLVLPHGRAQGLPYLEITTDPDNIASQKVIIANGGVLIKSFTKPAAFGSVPGLRFRIPL
jgi:hypothetical protein